MNISHQIIISEGTADFLYFQTNVRLVEKFAEVSGCPPLRSLAVSRTRLHYIDNLHHKYLANYIKHTILPINHLIHTSRTDKKTIFCLHSSQVEFAVSGPDGAGRVLEQFEGV